ncbi:MAG TPA: YlzJ-like family protein [Clostridia bacterium]|nr:YlzJ-like family protein [Clostridia bacterium]
MTFHSIIPIEDIFSINQLSPQDQTQIVQFSGIKAEVRFTGDNTYEIQRIFTTNLKDYLRSELQPGTRIKAGYTIQNER